MPAGRPRKPTARKKLEGDQPCRINRAEPEPPAGGVGDCPDHLDEIARDAWRRLTRILDAMGVLTSADADALAFYCVNFSLYIRAHQTVEDEGLTVATQFSTKPHPMLSVALNAEKQCARILAQFGMTPSARAALAIAPKDGDDEFLRYLKETQAAKQAARQARQAED